MKHECPIPGCGREFGSARALAIHLSKAHGTEASTPSELKRALQALAIAPEDVLAYKVYDDRVVIIEGPGGKKRIWRR